MLTGNDIGNLIADPTSVTTDQLQDLEALSEKYPYAQLFSILYLKGMHSSASLDFETALKTHSYRVSDRGQLYQLIHDYSTPLAETETEVAPATLEKEPSEPVAIDETSEAPEENKLREASEASSTGTSLELDTLPTEEFLESDSNPSESSISATNETDEIVTSVSEKVTEEVFQEEADLLPIATPNDALEENILHHAVASHYKMDELTESELAALEARKNQESALESVEEEQSNDIVKEEKEVSTPAEIEIESKQTFTSWLHADTNYIEVKDEQAPIKAVVQEFSEFDPMESLFGEVQKPKKEFFSPTKKAKESLNENQLPVSETLAKVYVMQGNYPKAIAAYRELILAFPEKKIFFANQIEDLQKKLNT